MLALGTQHHSLQVMRLLHALAECWLIVLLQVGSLGFLSPPCLLVTDWWWFAQSPCHCDCWVSLAFAVPLTFIVGSVWAFLPPSFFSCIALQCLSFLSLLSFQLVYLDLEWYSPPLDFVHISSRLGWLGYVVPPCLLHLSGFIPWLVVVWSCSAHCCGADCFLAFGTPMAVHTSW